MHLISTPNFDFVCNQWWCNS